MKWLRSLWAFLRPAPPAPWIGSCLRDRGKDRAFPPKRYEYPKETTDARPD